MDKSEMNLKIEKLVKFTCNYYEITESQLYGKCRELRFSEARNMLWYVLHYDFGISLTSIAKEFFRTKRRVCQSLSATSLRIRTSNGMRKIYDTYIDEYKKATTK